jgi:hypothetical protein
MRIEQMHYNFKLGVDRVASNDRPDFAPWEIDEYLNSAIMEFLKIRYNFNDKKNAFEVDQYRMSELSNLHIKSPELQPAVTPTSLGNGLYEVRLDSLGNNINGQYFRYLFLTKAVLTIQKNNCQKKIRLNLYQTDDFKTFFNQPDWDWGEVHAMFGKSTFVATPTASPVVNDSMDFTANLVTNPGLVTERFNNDQLQSLFIDTTDIDGVQQFTVVDACISYIKYPNRVFIGGYNHIDKHSTTATPQIQCDIDEAFHKDIVDLAVQMAMRDIIGQEQPVQK